MRAAAANVAVRATTAVGDITSRCPLMIEVKQEKGEYDTSTDPQVNKDRRQKKPLGITEGNTRDNQDSEKRDPPVALTTPGELVRLLISSASEASAKKVTTLHGFCVFSS